jgi:hypothetical protein
MLLRRLILGLLLTSTPLASTTARGELPAGVVNVVRPEFGDRISGGDYGLANIQRVEVGRSPGGPEEIRIVRALRDLRLSRRGEARFQVSVGQVGAIYTWVESPPVQGSWQLDLSVVHPDGYRETILSDEWQREGQYVPGVPPNATLEFRVTSKERNLKLSKRFIFTVSPVSLSLWSDFRPVPFTYERGIIRP